MRWHFGVIATLVWLTTGCGSARLPAGIGTPNIADTARFIEAATQQCAEFDSWTATVSFAGIIDRQRVGGRLLVAFTRPTIRIESDTASGEPPLVVVSAAAKTSVRSSDRRFEVSDSRDVVQALFGVRMPADVFGRTLAACELPGGFTTMRMFGSSLARLPLAGGSIYLHRATTTAPWQLVTMFYPGQTLHWAWRIDYEDVQSGIPVRSHLVSADANSDIHFRLSQVDTMVVFEVDDARFRIDGSPNTSVASPDLMRDIFYQSLDIR